MSILPVLLLSSVAVVGVARGTPVVPHDNDARLQPIVTPSQRRRICAELCLSGLGGEVCGENCLEILPRGLPFQSPSKTHDTSGNKTRRDACPILCTNRLGYPLCECEDVLMRTAAKPNAEPDFLQVCGFYCLKHKYKLDGCQSCGVYERAESENGGPLADVFGIERSAKVRGRGTPVDWEEWCKEMCLIGQGGAACNCDILPFFLNA